MSTKALRSDEIAAQLASLPGWEFSDHSLSKQYSMDSYLAGVNFVNIVAAVAESLQHHPDIYLGYKTVRLRFTTHDAGNRVSAKDIEAAKRIDALPIFRQ